MTSFYSESPFDSSYFRSLGTSQNDDFPDFETFSSAVSTGVPATSLATPRPDHVPSSFPTFDPDSPFNDLSRTTSDSGYMPYPTRSKDLGQSKTNPSIATVPATPVTVAEALRDFEQRFMSPPPQAAPIQPPMTGKRQRKNLTIKALPRAKSLSSLTQPLSLSTIGQAPLTPVSANGPSFYGLANAPDAVSRNGLGVDSGATQISFSDLYNYGLALDVGQDEGSAHVYPFQKPSLNANTAPAPLEDVYDNLPTPFLAHGSGFSSPSSVSYLSDPSPELASAVSLPMAQQQLSSHSMLSAPSIHSMPSTAGSPYALSTPATPQVVGRQRCVTYNPARPTQGIEEILDPILLSPHHPIANPMQRHASSPGYQAPKYSYPTRYSSDQGQAGPYLPPQQPAWSHQTSPHAPYHVPPIDPVQLFGMPSGPYQSYPMNRNNSSNYERNLEAFEEIYDSYSGASGYSTPKKRGRDDDDDDDYDDGSGEYIPESQSGHATRSKRLRTVASAPCLPTASRRMRPGPKPKVTKSPQEACQSVFSAVLSPTLSSGFRRGVSPYGDGGESGEESEHMQGVSTVPKEVIQSLYSGVPSHVGPDGQKVSKRYVCLIEGCERTFPRKSAIESHIQTHLEDKPFVCPQPDCDASFVRQHDLRRHERIHSGNKPFPCPCGKGFARGDALARHRARGICSGSLVPRRG